MCCVRSERGKLFSLETDMALMLAFAGELVRVTSEKSFAFR
ncbi:hypothetical protein V1283_000248 [Bradyrhizobium sp. AZCC 2262]